ncbi:hypothetical protein [Siccibacter turicensis]|uniref:hypothetical protein n=1 Tax=Siccibacter turicensis TaxID=357233 RepID=UPI003F57A2AD
MKKNNGVLLLLVSILLSMVMFVFLNLLCAFMVRGYVLIRYDEWQPYEITNFWDDFGSGIVVGIVFGIALTIGGVILKKLK